MTARRGDPGESGDTYVRDLRASHVEVQYEDWVRNDRTRPGEIKRMRHAARDFRYRPLISILLPVHRPDRRGLEQTISSLLDQGYQDWELRVLCAGPGDASHILPELYEPTEDRVKVEYAAAEMSPPEALDGLLSSATGDFVGFIRQGDALSAGALFEIVEALQRRPEPDVIYTDNDHVDGEGRRRRPQFKPGWSPELLLSYDYVGDLCLYRRTLLESVAGFRQGFETAEQYDLLLRVTEATQSVLHLPRVLYHRRGSRAATARAVRKTILAALERRDEAGALEESPLPGRFRLRAAVTDSPRVSIIIPTRDNTPFLQRCIESIEASASYADYEILIVDNASEEPETLEYLSRTPHRVLPFREEFNYSRVNNFAVFHATGEYLLFLNDDTEALSSGWLEEMLGQAQRPGVGAVGARLVYPDGRIQHAGVLVGVGAVWQPGVATHALQYFSADDPGYEGAAVLPRNYSAVTAACMMISRQVFEAAGGFDERLKTSFNDVDLCLKVRALGYRIVYTPLAELRHHESASRGYANSHAGALYVRERWSEVIDDDPYYNASFSAGAGDFNLRADMLRPKVLRHEDRTVTKEAAESWKDPWKMNTEELRRYVRERRNEARSLRRTTLLNSDPNFGGASMVSRALALRRRFGNLLKKARRKFRSRQHLRNDSARHIRPEQFVWIFGSPRTGSTWLGRMIEDQDRQEQWFEPYVGRLFGQFYEGLKGDENLLASEPFIFGEPYRKEWIHSIRNFILEQATVRFPTLRSGETLFVKEPNGSIGAPLIMEALSESRMVFLIRDSRDVVASRVDATRKGSWGVQNRDYSTPEKLNTYTKNVSKQYLQVVSLVKEAYDRHPGHKALVRYEELVQDTQGTMEKMYRDLGIPVDEASLRAAIERHSWSNIPREEKGSGKFFRKGEAGGWAEDLTPRQIEIVEKITGPLLEEFYGGSYPSGKAGPETRQAED